MAAPLRYNGAVVLTGGIAVSTVLRQLREGYEPAPLFDRRSGFSYAVMGAGLAITIILFVVRGLSIDPRLVIAPAWVGMAMVAGWLARRAQLARVATALESTGLVYGQGFVFLALIYVLMTFNVPLADAPLAAGDRALGFHWPDLAEPFRRNAVLLGLAKVVYMSFNWEPALVTISLSIAGLSGRAWRFVAAATISLAFASTVGSLALPAEGAAVYYHAKPWPEMVGLWSQSHVIHALRSGRQFIDPGLITGLISFPSYHACSAVLYAWAMWPLRCLRWPIVVLNVGMAFFAIVGGGHYLVDIIAGALLGCASALLAVKYVSETPQPRAAAGSRTSMTPISSA